MRIKSLFIALLVFGTLPLYSQVTADGFEKLTFKELLKKGNSLKTTIRETLINDLGATSGKEGLGTIDGEIRGLLTHGEIHGETYGSAKNIGPEVFIIEDMFEGFEDLFASMKQLIKDNPTLPQSDCFRNFYKLFEHTEKTRITLKGLKDGNIKKLKTILTLLEDRAINGKDINGKDISDMDYNIYKDLYAWTFGSYVVGKVSSVYSDFHSIGWEDFEADIGIFEKELYIDAPKYFYGFSNDCDTPNSYRDTRETFFQEKEEILLRMY